MSIRLEVLNLLPSNGSQGSVHLACFSCSQTRWDLLPFDSLFNEHSICSIGLPWKNHSLAFVSTRLIGSSVIVVSVSLIMQLAMLCMIDWKGE